ncbi:MAG: ATP synthase subunit C family protein [Alphaproteobacteria bacterium]|nr:ATP synthase subunit C family protein [Alphaproteobacteria bacterium]
MDIGAAKMIGAGLATFALLGVGLALGNIFSTLISSIARNPSAKSDLLPVGLLGFALTESIALLAFIVAMLILFSK